MSLNIASIASGSNGNCYYIGNGVEAVLIDAGISCKETERRMSRLALPIEQVKAIFISHEHIDHIKGVSVLARKYDLPVYVTPGTAHGGRLNLSAAFTVPFGTEESVQIGGLTITAFKKYHDAWDPHSFTVAGNGTTIGVFTDLGQVCDKLVYHFKKCHAAFLESNYDTDMLMNGRYPYHLKTRISGGKGHLSNAQAFELFIHHRPQHMTHLLLSHLSKENNDPKLALDLFLSKASGINITVASRDEESQVYRINGLTKGRVVFEGIPPAKASIQQVLF
jgi:phosphoribosyl 1,2-cyclic phosphodiesterase